MTTPTLATLHPSTDLVAVAWLRTLPGLVADGVANQLPANEKSWATNGFVVVPMTVGGTPHSTMPLRRPVVQCECWGTVPGSDKLPWGIPSQLAEQIRFGCLDRDRNTFGRLLTIAANGVTYAPARVLSAKMLTEPHRVLSDAGDYAGVLFNLSLQWVAASGEEVQ
jgi:hypothetical protein